MATFPSLEPRTRSLQYGDFPQLVHENISGGDVRFLQGTDRLTQRLSLGYEYLTEAEMTLLNNHYQTQQGSIIPFDLSSSVWAGYASGAPVSSSDYQWRYVGAFEIGIAAPLRYNVTIELESVPI